jgi:hypothetical protein
MKICDIMETVSAGATSSGSVAVVNSALGPTLSRSGSTMLNGKYSTESTPNTPEEFKRLKHNARGRFKNSPGN